MSLRSLCSTKARSSPLPVVVVLPAVQRLAALGAAKSWLQRFPAWAFKEPKCAWPLPVPVPSDSSVGFHPVAVTRP